MAQTVKRLPAMQETRVRSWVGKILWRRKWQPTPVPLPRKFHGWRSLVGYTPWGSQRVRHNWATSLSLCKEREEIYILCVKQRISFHVILLLRKLWVKKNLSPTASQSSSVGDNVITHPFLLARLWCVSSEKLNILTFYIVLSTGDEQGCEAWWI